MGARHSAWWAGSPCTWPGEWFPLGWVLTNPPPRGYNCESESEPAHLSESGSLRGTRCAGLKESTMASEKSFTVFPVSLLSPIAGLRAP